MAAGLEDTSFGCAFATPPAKNKAAAAVVMNKRRIRVISISIGFTCITQPGGSPLTIFFVPPRLSMRG